MRIKRRSFLAGLFGLLERYGAPEEIQQQVNKVDELVDWEMFRFGCENQLENKNSLDLS